MLELPSELELISREAIALFLQLVNLTEFELHESYGIRATSPDPTLFETLSHRRSKLMRKDATFELSLATGARH